MAEETKGRLDVLADALLGHLVKRSNNPLLEAAHETFRPQIRTGLGELVGPETEFGEKTRGALTHAQTFYENARRIQERRRAK